MTDTYRTREIYQKLKFETVEHVWLIAYKTTSHYLARDSTKFIGPQGTFWVAKLFYCNNNDLLCVQTYPNSNQQEGVFASFVYKLENGNSVLTKSTRLKQRKPFTPNDANNTITALINRKSLANFISDDQSFTIKITVNVLSEDCDIDCVSDNFVDKLITFNTAASDCKIQCKNGGIVESHKMLLGAQSEVLAKAFNPEHNFEEYQTGVIKMEDTDQAVVEQLVHYVSSGTVDFDLIDEQNISVGLLMLADKYLIQELKDTISYHLGKKLSIENACDTLKTARVSKSELLLQMCLDFFGKKQDKVKSMRGWEEMIKHFIDSDREFFYQHIRTIG